jgi:hypothetical protein
MSDVQHELVGKFVSLLSQLDYMRHRTERDGYHHQRAIAEESLTWILDYVSEDFEPELEAAREVLARRVRR